MCLLFESFLKTPNLNIIFFQEEGHCGNDEKRVAVKIVFLKGIAAIGRGTTVIDIVKY